MKGYQRRNKFRSERRKQQKLNILNGCLPSPRIWGTPGYSYCFYEEVSHWFNGPNQMIISTIQEDGTENEFEISVCCETCSKLKYGWNLRQHTIIKENIKNEQFKIPNNISTKQQFLNFVKSL